MSPDNVVISRDARGLSPPQPYKLSALGQAGSPSGPLSAAFQGLNFEKIPLARGQERGLRSPSRSQPEGDYLVALREFWTHFYFVFPLFGQKTRSRRFFAHRIFEKIEIIFGDYQHESINKKILIKRKKKKNRERGGVQFKIRQGGKRLGAGILLSNRNPDKNLKPAAILIFFGGHFRQDSR